jgi:hypothetical protein
MLAYSLKAATAFESHGRETHYMGLGLSQFRCRSTFRFRSATGTDLRRVGLGWTLPGLRQRHHATNATHSLRRASNSLTFVRIARYANTDDLTWTHTTGRGPGGRFEQKRRTLTYGKFGLGTQVLVTRVRIVRVLGTRIQGTLTRRTPVLGSEPLSHTHELFGSGGSLHFFEHAAKRVSGGCRGIRQLVFTHYALRNSLVRITRVRFTGVRFTGVRNATTLGTQTTQRSLTWFRQAERTSVDNRAGNSILCTLWEASAVSRETSVKVKTRDLRAARFAATLPSTAVRSTGSSFCVPRMMTINRDTMATRRRKIGWPAKSS